MKQIQELAEHLLSVRRLRREIEDKDFWINKAIEEAGFTPEEGDWVAVNVEIWKIAVSVYHKHGIKGAKYWINGKWFDTPFPQEFVDLSNLKH